MKRIRSVVLILFILTIKYTHGQTNTPVVLGYFPSWSESWTSPGNNSLLREIPSHVNHVFLSFAKPDLTYVQGSYDISTTGIQTPYDGCTLKESVKVLSDKGTKVILSIGGETYWNSPTAYNINYQQIKDLVDDMGFAGIDWDYEPNGSFSGIGTPTNVQHFIDFITFSRALMPKAQGYIIACAPSGVGALGGITNDDTNSPFGFSNRNTLTGETDTNLYNATALTNGINMFGFSATGHMIPVFAAVGDDIDLVAYQGYNLGASTNRTLMYDAFAYYAEIHEFKIAAGVHYPNEPWGPYYTYTHSNVASLSTHISNNPNGNGDGIMIWQLLMSGETSSAYSYMHVASDVLNGETEINALENANNFTMEIYSGGSETSCFCLAPSPALGTDQSICGLSSITLNSNVSLQTGITFTWKLDDTVIVQDSPTQNTYNITQPGVYTVEVEEDGCMNTDVVVITDNLPWFNLGNNFNICTNGSAELNTGFSDPNYSYTWSQDDVNISDETNSSYTATSAGTYEVIVSATGCTSTSDNAIVSDDFPLFDLGGSVHLCSPTTTTINTDFNDSSFSYIWTMDGNPIPGATSSSYLVNSAGTFEVTISAPNCSLGTGDVIITSSLPVASNDTICNAGAINLTASQNVEWYDNQTEGTLLNVGNSYAPTISTSTDYWITAGGSTQSLSTLKSAFEEGGWQQFPYVYGTKFIVSQNLTLDDVTVDAGGGDVTINVVADDGTSVIATTTLTGVSGITTVPLDFVLSPGIYYLNTVNSTSNLYVDLTPASDFNNPGVLLVEGEAYWDWGTPAGSNYAPSGDYGTFINLNYSLGTACDRVLVSGVIDPFNAGCNTEPCTNTYSSITETACESYISPSGNYTWTVSNTYLDTLINGNVAGCDSIITVDLSILPQQVGTHNETVCFGESILVNGTTYDANNLTGTEIFTNEGTNNCDSIVSVNLTILPQLTGTHNETVCFGESILVNGTIYDGNNPTGTEIFTNIGPNNCDSLVSVNLTILDEIDTSTTNIDLTITANQTGATYQWIDCNDGNNIIIGETNPSYTANENGSYAVIITSENCFDTSSCVIISSININENSSFKEVSIYPNPSQGIVNIELGTLLNVTIQVLNSSGQLIYTKENINTSKHQFELNVASGIYFIEINSNNEKQKYELIIK